MNKTRLSVLLTAVAAMTLLPALAKAQSSISGVVKDASGAVIANASVQASSDVLIEKVRSVVTNGEGRYTMIDLRPGSYVVTATAPGFDTVKQTIEVPANVTVPVDATLKIGSIGETVNVESRVATVDTENAAHPNTLSRAEMDELPSGRYMQSIASYVPGAHLNVPDIGGSQQIEQNYVSVHGSGSAHDTYLLDGMLVNTTYADGQIQQYIDNAAIQESTYQTSNVTAESSGGGMFTNLVPKDGGNQFHLNLFAGGSAGTGFWQAGNTDPNLLLRNLSGQVKIIKIEDFDGSFGGPVIKDKLWFMMTGREQVTYTQAGVSVLPDGTPGIQDGHIYDGTFRLTYQINSKNKVSAFWLRNWKYKEKEILDGGVGYIPFDPTVAAQQRNKWPLYYILQTRWTGTLSARMVVQAGVSISHLDWNDLYQNGILRAPGTPEFYSKTTQVDDGTGLRYVSGAGNNYMHNNRNVYTATATYIIGSHQIRGGGNFSNGRNDVSSVINGDGVEHFNNGVPVSFQAYNTPYTSTPYLKGDLGLFATDTWHYKRLAITAGIRFEYLAAEIKAENAPAARFAPARTIPQIDCSTIKGMGCWKDWTPRIGFVYDVFGNHKTALKAGFGKYNSQYATGFTANFNPLTGISESNVPWNFAALGSACDVIHAPQGPQPNPLCFATGGFAPQGTVGLAGVPPGGLGASPIPNFGAVSNSTGINLDPNWHRDYNYQYNAGIQQEVFRGITLNLNWFRRSSYQSFFLVNENDVPASSWSPFTIVNPLDGTPITIFNLDPAIKALPKASLYETNGPQSLVRNTYTGYEAQVVARLSHGLFVSAGWTIDRQLDRACAQNVTTGKSLSDPNTLRFCDTFGDQSLSFKGINVASLGKVAPPWAKNYTAQASLPIRWGLVGSISFLSNNYQGGFTGSAGSGTLNNGYLARTISIASAKTSVYPNGSVGVAPALSAAAVAAGGCATAGPTVGCPIDPGYNGLQGGETINLVSPGQVRTPRLNQLDLSLKRTFRFRERYVVEPTIQVFNLLNTNAVSSQSTGISASYSPTSPGVAQFLSPSACATSTVGSFANCGAGGNVQVITNPRLLRLAMLFRF